MPQADPPRTPSRGEFLIEASTAIEHADELLFVEVAPWRVMASGPDPISGSIPDAVGASIAQDFAGTPTATSGHLPLPAAASVHALVRRWGAVDGRRIVLYTRRVEELSSATRAWFVLGWAKAARALVLDGGLPAWVRAGGPLAARLAEQSASSADPCRTARTDVGGPSPESWSEFTALSAPELLERAGWGTVLDARPLDAHHGFTDDPRSGHVPHALHAPTESLLTEEGRFRSTIDLRKWFLARRALGAHDVGAYCGGGVASSMVVFAAALVGQPVGLYVDSWSAWQRDDSLPVERGALLTRSRVVDSDCS